MLVTLELLQDVPVHAITTRLIASHVKVTQPALFRHFESRDALLLGVVDQVREQLGRAALGVLERQLAPLATGQLLLRSLFEHVEQFPGILRLLFHDAAAGDDVLHAPLAELIDLARVQLARLVHQAQREGDLPSDIDPDEAGRLMVALAQGILLQWQLDGRPDNLASRVDPLFDLWLGGVGAVVGPSVPTVPQGVRRPLVHLDLRPVLDRGRDPMTSVVTSLDRVTSDGVLLLVSPFSPQPLLVLLASRGLSVQHRSVGDEVWEVLASRPDAPELLDLSHLAKPEPMMRSLQACGALAPGGLFLARYPHVPGHLVQRLEGEGFEVLHHECEDGLGLVCARAPAAQ